MVWVKVCGITSAEEALKIADLEPDALGFILSTGSRRRISLAGAESVIAQVRKRYGPRSPGMVGVFVNEPVSYICQAIENLALDMVQLSGSEDRGYIKDVKKTGVAVIKAIACKPETDIQAIIEDLERMADYYLADTYSKNSYGGSGKTFDWRIVSRLKMKEKLIVAGGLGPDNVAEAINTVDPFGVDASSGLELPEGGKDKEKVKKFITLARGKGGHHG